MISRYIFTLAFLSSVVFTQTINRYGSTAANFLEIGVGSANAAMGDAGVTIAEGPSAVYWNPAALAFIEFLHSTSAQEHFTNSVYEFPLAAGVTPNVLLPDIDSLNSPSNLNWSALSLWQEKAVELIAQAGF